MNRIMIYFEEGGIWVMGSIAAVLFISLIIIIERVYRLWLVYDQVNSHEFMKLIQKMILNNSTENAIRLCKKSRPRLVPTVLAEGLKRAGDSQEEIEFAIEHAVLDASPKVMKTVPFLATTANVATLLGLLGTIFGLMNAFGAVATLNGPEKSTKLAEGIAEALNATSFGLSVALLCLFFYGVLSAKQNAIIQDINKNSAKLLDLLYTRKMKLKGTSK